MKWLLILTLITGGYRETSVTTTSVGPFHTQAACLRAGNAWIKANGKHYQVDYIRAMCVRDQ